VFSLAIINVPDPLQGIFTIQDGVNAAAPGDTVLVSPGFYPEQVNITKSIQLLGAQHGVDARNRTGAPESVVSFVVPGGNGIIMVNADNVIVDGFTVENNTNGSGIQTSTDFSGYGIFNNIIQFNSYGLNLHSNGINTSEISRNFFNTNTFVGGLNQGIYSDQGAGNITISQNRFTGHDPDFGTSINFASITDPQFNILIEENELNDSSIAITNTENVNILRNQLIGIPASAIFIYGGTNSTNISNNFLYNNTRAINILLAFGSTTANTNIEAHENCIQGNETGLIVQAGGYSGVLDVTNNWWGDPSGPSGIGPGTGDSIVNEDENTTILFDPWLLEAPCITIICPVDITVPNDPGQEGAIVNYPPPTVIDQCPDGFTAFCSPPSGSFFLVGTTSVTCTVTDPCGGAASCSFTVTVLPINPGGIQVQRTTFSASVIRSNRRI
jgi:hypothetical protein